MIYLTYKKMLANNEQEEMTRRHPKLAMKVLKRDAQIAKKIQVAWDIEKSPQKVLSIFLSECSKLSDERYWEIMRSVWIIAGSSESFAIFRKLMQSNRKEKYFFSTPEESKKLREMPESFLVYRATNVENDGGLSWTTSLEYANFYAKEYGRSKILQKTINKKEVFAYINRNKESEILIL